MFTAVVLTISTKGAISEREDTSGPNLVKILKNENYDVKKLDIVSDNFEQIKTKLIEYSNDNIDLVLTTGGTGFAETDVTPEATKNIIEKEVPGIPEMMRIKNYVNTENSCLSRGICGILKKTLILNLPGSKIAAEENLLVVLKPLKHGIEILNTSGSANCAREV